MDVKGRLAAHWAEPPRETNRDKATKVEARLSPLLAARTTPNSGATPMASQKGDLQGDDFVWESKSTVGGRIVLTAGTIEKVCREAAAVGKNPGLVMSLEGLPDHLPRDWAVVPADLVRSLLGTSE